jgi:hypothetical protein
LDPQQVERARRHAHAIFRRRIWMMRSFALARPGTANAALEPTFDSLTTLQQNGDLRRFAAWAASPDIDYLTAAAEMTA